MAQGSSNPTTDVKKVGGTNVDVNTGNASAGTQRVVLATNQPVIPVSDNGSSLTVDGTVAATQSGTWNIATVTNQTQMNGQAISMGTGVRDAGTQRVTIATNDSVPVTGTFWQATQPVSGTFWQATQPVSIASTIAVNQTQVNGSAVVTGGTAGTQAIGGVQAHDAVVSGNNPVLTGGVANTSTPTAVASGDVAQFWTTTSGALNVADGGSSLTVDGTVAATQSGTWNIATVTNLSQLGGTAISMNTGVRDAGTQRVTIATNDSVPVTGAFFQATQPVSIASTIAVNQTQVNGSAVVTGGTAGTQAIGGVQAHDAVVSGNNPVLIGGVANASAPAAVASGDVAQFWTTTSGALNVAAPIGTPVFTRVTDGTNTMPTADVAARSSFHRVTDGTNTAAVKAASTAAAASDPSLVVGLSPNSPLPAGTNGIGKLTVNDGVDIGDVTINNTAAAGVFSRITDGTTTAAVKAASTAAGATDPALVVAVSPNNTVGTNIAQIGATTVVTGGTNGTLAIGGVQDHDAAISGNKPVLAGGYAYGVAVADNTLPAVSANADVARFLTNKNGAMIAVSMPDGTQAYAPTNATTSAYAASLVVKASAGTMYMLTGYSSRANAQFVQIHNATSLPANGSVPAVVFRVTETANFSFDLGQYGRYFSTGIVVCVSSTGPTLTVGSADTWFDVQYK